MEAITSYYLLQFARPVTKGMSRLKKKASCGIDKVSTLHITNRNYVWMRHLSLLKQMIFDAVTIPSTFCIGDLTPIPKKENLSRYVPPSFTSQSLLRFVNFLNSVLVMS